MTRIVPPYQLKHQQAQEQAAATVDQGHGRKESRRLTSTTSLKGFLDWPAVGQVFELERVRLMRDRVEVEVVYGITSLRRAQADAADVLELIRGHWGIENRLHDGKDATLGEDRFRVRPGSSPPVLSMLRNVAVPWLEGVEAPSQAAATRRFMIHPNEALLLLRVCLETNRSGVGAGA